MPALNPARGPGASVALCVARGAPTTSLHRRAVALPLCDSRSRNARGHRLLACSLL
jgi:hypothetical protein